MNNHISDQELGKMVQTIAEQYSPSPISSSLNPTIKRILISFGLLTIFIGLIFFFIKQTSTSVRHTKYPKTVQILPFDETNSAEQSIEIAVTPPPTIPTTNPVQIPLPPLPVPPTLPLPIPDYQTEIRPLIPPTPLPQAPINTPEPTKNSLETKTQSDPQSSSPPTDEKEAPKVKEETNSVIDIQLTNPDDDL